MIRSCLSATVLILLVLSPLVLSSATATQPLVGVDPLAAHPALRQKLNSPTSLPKGIDPNTPLKDALEFFSDLWDVTILIDTNAFKAVGLQDPRIIPVDLPEISEVRFGSVLQLLLNKVNPPATYWAGHDYLVVTTRRKASQREDAPREQLPVPLVDVECRDKPLVQVLRDLSDTAGHLLALDTNLGVKSATKITLTLRRVTLSTALQKVAETAGLQTVALDEVFYLTTRANAEALQAEQRRREKQRGNSKEKLRELPPVFRP